MTRSQFLATAIGISALSQIKCALPQTPFSKELLLGQENPDLRNDQVPLLEEAGSSFEKMQQAAKAEGIQLKIVSAYRSYDRQKGIWNRKFKANAAAGLSPEKNIAKIITYSTLPGTSRHHWGTDVDLIDGNPPAEGDVLVSQKFHNQGPYALMFEWMQKNAASYGFLLPYTNDAQRPGFYYEPWHYSYAPLSIPMLKAYLTLDLKTLLTPADLLGKECVDEAFLKSYLQNNVLGIAAALKE
jgi:LAS superfamily LD-carboxypeptidase LdcB